MISPVGVAEASAAAFVAGGVNAISGGGTLLTFPILIGLGESSIIANATSTVGLWPGVIGSLWGYRRDLRNLGKWPLVISVPSIAGGCVGALLLLHTPKHTFDRIAPFLVLGATLLFMFHTAIARRLGASAEHHDDDAAPPLRPGRLASYMFFQFAVSVYGGYFGAGIGILMLAALGIMGLKNIHRMNGLKAWGAFCINGAAIGLFIVNGIVDWKVAIPMATGGILGGYAGARLARFVGPPIVRKIIIGVGLSATVSLLWWR